jgi:fumarylacetoacetate (FAA) hydrolase family protein
VFDDRFGLEQLRVEEIALRVEGSDGFVLTGVSGLSRISRPFEELMQAVRGTHHQYPDGYALYTGTLFAPIEDRDEPGRGFTHMLGDVVSISSPSLGTLVNTVGRSEELPPWEFGLSDLYHYLRTLPMRV